MSSDLIIAAVTAALIELILHWFPWRLWLRRDLSKVAAYIIGVLGLAGPLSWLYLRQGEVRAILELWVVLTIGGIAVLMAYTLDGLALRLTQLREAKERANHYEKRQADQTRGKPPA